MNKNMDNSLFKLLSLRLLFGHYFKLSASKIICFVAKIFCILVFIFNCFICFTYTLNTFDFGKKISILINLWIMLIETTSSILISLYTEEAYVLRFSTKMKNYISSSSTCRATYILAFLIIPMNLFSFLVTYHYGLGAANNALYNISYTVCYYRYLTSLYIMEKYAKAYNNLSVTTVNRLKDININDEEKRVCIKHFLDNYLKLMKIFKATMTMLRINTISGFTFGFLRVIILLFYVVIHGFFVPVIMLWCVQVFVYVAFVGTPLIFVEMVSSDLDVVKSIITRQLFLYEDKKLQKTVHEALKFMDIYKMSHCIWNEFPLGINTLFGFVNLCVSYIIALLQFSY